MTTIRQEDFIQSIADAFQYISYYHRVDYIRALHEAYLREESPAAKDAMAQILINSRMAAEGHRPICRDTGICIAFIRVGMDVRWDTWLSLEQLVNEGVRRAYTDPVNPLRGSMLTDPDGLRQNWENTGCHDLAVCWNFAYSLVKTRLMENLLRFSKFMTLFALRQSKPVHPSTSSGRTETRLS